MGVFDREHYGVWNDSSVINEMLDIVKADVAKASAQCQDYPSCHADSRPGNTTTTPNTSSDACKTAKL